MRRASSIGVCFWLLQACAVNGGDVAARDASTGFDASFGVGGSGAFGGSGGFAAIGGLGGLGGFSGGGGTGGVGGACGVCPVSKIVLPPDPLEQCCTDEGECGVTSYEIGQCLVPDAPGLPDTHCPTTARGVRERLRGCCTRRGECGVMLDHLGIGCVERTRASTIPPMTIEDPYTSIPCWITDDSDGGVDTGEAICAWARTGYCAANALCHVEADVPICECPPGFADLSSADRRGVECRDINECLGSPPPCGTDTCVNTVGSFVCAAAAN